MTKLTTNEFISKAIFVHGNKYDYSKVDYKGVLKNVDIICLNHGMFSQISRNHLLGKGCPKCAGTLKSNTKEFILKSIAVHGNVYDYSRVKYINNYVPVEILCKIHGGFKQIPTNHLSGKGCKKCSNNILLTTPEFVEKATKIHNEKYDYSLVVYKGAHQKIKILCKKHGEFLQTPRNHLNGQNCPICTYRISAPEQEFMDFLNISKQNRQSLVEGYNVDGFEPITNSIYEFLGNYWHGNPMMHLPSSINSHCKKSFGQLYSETLTKFQWLLNKGYNVYYIWEKDWKNWNKSGYVPLRKYNGQPI